jgi:hypothetical protein
LLATDATAADVDVHAIGADVIVAPAASRAVTLSVAGCPGTSVSAALESVSVATTGAVTVTVMEPDTAVFDELVARMVALPAAMAVTVADVPLPETDAIDGASDVHVMALLEPVGATIAPTEPVPPTSSASVPGERVMDVMGGVDGFVGPSSPPPHAVADKSPSSAAKAMRVLALMVCA